MSYRGKRRVVWLWCLLPRDLREVYSDEMADVLDERVTEERTNGGRVAALWYQLRVGIDLIGVVARAWGARCRALFAPANGPRSRRSVMDSLPQALGFAIRALRRRPGFTTVAVLTLALSIGANATMFSVVNTVVLGPLPFVTPDRVVQLWDNYPNGLGEEWEMSQPNFRDYQSQNTVFERFAAVSSRVTLWAEGEDRVTPLNALHASARSARHDGRCADPRSNVPS